jgi:Glutamine phosphoribosylpyrophosphate amidotransferase
MEGASFSSTTRSCEDDEPQDRADGAGGGREGSARQDQLSADDLAVFYGVDTPRKAELIGATHTLEEIREFLEADSVAYLSLDGMLSACRVRGARIARRAIRASIRSSSRVIRQRICSLR